MKICKTCEHSLIFKEDDCYACICYRYPEEISTSRTHHCGEWKAKEDDVLKEYPIG